MEEELSCKINTFVNQNQIFFIKTNFNIKKTVLNSPYIETIFS